MYIKREVLTMEALGKAINRLRFKTHIWKAYAEKDRIYTMVNDVRILCGQDPMPRGQFEEGLKYCNIFSPVYKHALEEFKALCAGDW